MHRKCAHLLAVLALATTAGPAAALTLDFDDVGEGFVHGSKVDASQGVTITTLNFNPATGHPNQAVAFDTTRTGPTADPDLQQGSGWAKGNLAPATVLDNILIIQENTTGCTTGVCTDPDDEGRRAAGSFTLDFDPSGLGIRFQTFAFDLVDVEGASMENGSVEFLLGGSQVGLFDFDHFLTLGQSVDYGNRSANRVDLGIVGEYDEVVITMGGSGGVDNILVLVPEPRSFALLGLGLVGLALLGRVKRSG